VNLLLVIKFNKFQERTYFATLLFDGFIQSAGGERFKTLPQWCLALTSGLGTKSVKKATAYERVRL